MPDDHPPTFDDLVAQLPLAREQYNSHIAALKDAAAKIPIDEFDDTCQRRRTIAGNASPGISKKYAEEVLQILDMEALIRKDGTPENDAEDLMAGLTLTEIDEYRGDLRQREADLEEGSGLPPRERDASPGADSGAGVGVPPDEEVANGIRDERLDDACAAIAANLETSRKADRIAENHTGSSTNTSAACGSSAGNTQDQIEAAARAVEPGRTPAQRTLLERHEEYMAQHPEIVPPYDRMQGVSCQKNNCRQLHMVKGKVWYCDELVTGIFMPPDEEKYQEGKDIADLYAGEQLAYAAWANGVTAGVKVVEDGTTKGAKAFASMKDTVGTAGTFAGWIGVGLGVFDLVLCARRWTKTKNRVKDLNGLFKKHFTDNPTEVKIQGRLLDYAITKKNRKLGFTVLAAHATLTGVAGGVMGGIAFLASNPIGWGFAIGLGILAVLEGLGLIALRRKRKKSKKKLARKEAERVIHCYTREMSRQNRATASQIIRAIDKDRGTSDENDYYEAKDHKPDNVVLTELLTEYSLDRREKERQTMASAIVTFFIWETDAFLRTDPAKRRVAATAPKWTKWKKKFWKNKKTTEFFDALDADGWLDNNFGGAVLAALNLNPAQMIKAYAKLMVRLAIEAPETLSDADRKKLLADRQKLHAHWIKKVMGKLKS